MFVASLLLVLWEPLIFFCWLRVPWAVPLQLLLVWVLAFGLRPALQFSLSPPGVALSPLFHALRAAPARAPPEVEAGREIRLFVVFTGWSDLLIIRFRSSFFSQVLHGGAWRAFYTWYFNLLACLRSHSLPVVCRPDSLDHKHNVHFNSNRKENTREWTK